MTELLGGRGVRAFLLSALLLFVTSAQAAPALDPTVLMRESDTRHRIPDEQTRSTMVLQESGGQTRSRGVDFTFAQDDAAGDKLRVRFSSPADIKGTVLLSAEQKGGDDEQWLYLPAFRKTRRVGSSELGDRFVGSDFFFEDLKRHRIEDYGYKLLGSDKLGADDCHLIEVTPVAERVKAQTPYGKTNVWLRKDNLYPVRIRFFDRDLKPLKELEATKLKQVAGKAWRADQLTMVDVRRKHRTVLMNEERKVNVGLGADTFSKHALEAE